MEGKCAGEKKRVPNKTSADKAGSNAGQTQTRRMRLRLLFSFLSIATTQGFKPKPNIILLLTDDEDLELFRAIKGTRHEELTLKGTTLNGFVTTPLCCPSRASILTGLYSHSHGVVNNTRQGNCASDHWRRRREAGSLGPRMAKAGYETFYAGKYLNGYGKGPAGAYAPPGWSWWAGLMGNSVYYNYSLSLNGTERAYGDEEGDYLTTVIGGLAGEFLRANRKEPFFMMLCPPAPHAPFDAEDKYKRRFPSSIAPRTPNYDVGGKGKHWLLRQTPSPMAEKVAEEVDESYRKRRRTLLSVDDLLRDLVVELSRRGSLNNTYIIYSSDNGYHTGQFSLPLDKRQLYDFDLRVPLVVRGPGIAANTSRPQQVLNIDLAPTILDLAGVAEPERGMDGRSVLPLLGLKRRRRGWRHEFLVEYQGQSKGGVPKDCPRRKGMSECHPGCVCEDSANNTYSCVRWRRTRNEGIYCVFQDSEDFRELYDLRKDPFQLTNLAYNAPKERLQRYERRLKRLKMCRGSVCG